MSRPLVCECGACATCKSRERMRRLRAENPERVHGVDRERYYRDRKKRLAAMAERAKRYAGTPQRQARVAVGNAIRAGRLVRPAECQKCARSCVPHAHHDDYSRPLDVRWLCTGCHGEEHRRAA